MPGQSRPRKLSLGGPEETKGLQLLSPTLQQSIQNTTSKLSSSHPAEFFGWSTTPPAGFASPGLSSSFVNADEKDNQNNNEKDGTNPIRFDFDGFTLESVRGRKKAEEEDAIRSSARSARSTSAGLEQQSEAPTDYCAFYYDDIAKSNPLSCSTNSARTTTASEDFEMSRRQRQNSFHNQIQRSSVMCRPDPPMVRSVNTNRGTFHMSATAAAAGFPMAKKKELTAVAMRGWLQKRKGLVLKRWKPYYCLFKSDDSLCLYTSEDTVNGKLEQRYQILRVGLTDKNDSFHIIGVDSEGVPRREEFRVSISPEWERWFQVLGKFFDNSSMEQALVRKPELTFNKTFNEGEEDDWVDSDSVAPGTILPTHQRYDERRSYFSQRKQPSAAVHDSFDGSGDDKTSSVSTFSGSSAPSVRTSNQTGEVNSSQAKAQKLSDCPMIERISQGTLPIVEIRGSESKPADVACSFPWTK